MTMGCPKVFIVLLNWNQEDLTVACLESLRKMTYPDFQIVLVDNGSKPGSLGLVEQGFPEIILVKNERNLGFTGGNNVGIQRALAEGADYVMLLNNDTEVDPAMLQHLVEMTESDERIGVVGPIIYYYDDPRRVWSAGATIDWRTGRTLSLREGELDAGDHRAPQEVDFVSGCAFLIKRRVIDDIGLLDERFFIYYEETDWCVRARRAGYGTWLVPAAMVWHKINLAEREATPRYIYLMTRNKLLFLRKSGFSFWKIAWLILTKDMRIVLSWSLRSRHRAKRSLRRAKLWGIWDFMQGRFGEPPTD